MNGLIGIYGASGHGRETLPIARLQFSEPGTSIVFIDDDLSEKTINGHEIISWRSFLSWPVEIKHVSLAIANSFTRQKLADKCRLHGIKFTQIQLCLPTGHF